MECEPPELLPSMPPMVARFEVEVSGPKSSPSGPHVVVQLVLHEPGLHPRPQLLAVDLEHVPI